MEKYYTPEEAAEFIKVKKTTIWTWLRTGKLQGIKTGKIWRIKGGDLEKFLNIPDPQNNKLDDVEITLIQIERLLSEIDGDNVSRETVEKVKSALLKMKVYLVQHKD